MGRDKDRKKMVVRNMGLEDVKGTYIAQVKDRWPVTVNTLTNIWLYKMRGLYFILAEVLSGSHERLCSL